MNLPSRRAAEPPSRPMRRDAETPRRLDRRLLIAVSALLVACGPGRSPVPPDEVLPFGSDTIQTHWSELPLAATSQSRFVVVSADWDSAAYTNFAAHSLEPLGGAGQRAYLHPFQVFAARDTVYLADWGKRRTTAWSPEGTLVDSVPVVDALRGSYVRARDAAGNWYFQVDPVPGKDGSGNQDSSAVVRAPRSLTRFDTVARLTPLELARVSRDNQPRFERRVFSGNDIWSVWPDGTIWIARRFRNQLETINPQGQVSRGSELPDPVYEITGPDRMEYLNSYPEEVRPKEMEVAWAIIHPPFYAAFAAPDGSIWLEKSKPAADSLRKIHVLDRSGTLQRVLVIKGQGRLLAVGPGTLLVGERSADGVRLLSVRVPDAPVRPAARE